MATTTNPNTNPSSSNSNGSTSVRLLFDPSLATCPDYSTAAYDELRNSIDGGTDPAAGIAKLKASWTKQNDAEKAQWTIQVEADRVSAEAEATRLGQEAARAGQVAEQLAEQERLDAEKKLPKLGDFDESRGPSSFVETSISPFPQKKLERREYCPLWPFTTAGLNEAAAALVSSGEDASSITLDRTDDNHLAVRSGPSSSTHKNMVRDENLLYREFLLASHRYIKEIKRIGWDQKHIEALTGFFYGIDTDPMRSQDHGDKVVLIYADRYRLDWFNTLGVPGKSFNIAQINHALMDKICTEYLNKLQRQTIAS
ncbi:hypothetical protein B0H16DRAFT_1339302 [Mycena metata]|uniref:Uncharacterized protein n=1 Tax=Mycena metata TaxID=1033252 RepID=A0AAD7HBA4_9AGAR|nr:hypothetical protein B0H16DRAFT_1339302 [Mycena metata]